MTAQRRIPKGMPSPIPTLAALLSPADLGDGGMGLLEGVMVVGVCVGAMEEARMVVEWDGDGEERVLRGVLEERGLVGEDDWSCVSMDE